MIIIYLISLSVKHLSFSLPDNLEGLVILFVVDAHDEHGSISAGGRDDDSLGTTLQMSLE